MDGLKVAELVVVDVYGDGKEKASVPPVDELVVVVLDEVGVLLVAGGDEAVDLALDPDLLCLGAGARGGRWRNVPLGGGAAARLLGSHHPQSTSDRHIMVT